VNLNNLNRKIYFSLDERKSNIIITPYHLSLITSIYSTVQKSNGEFNIPFYIAEYIAKRAIKYYLTEYKSEEKSGKKEQSNLLRLKYADIACGTGNLILALLYKLKERIEKEKKIENEELIEFISSNIYCYDNNQLALKINELRLLTFMERAIELLKKRGVLGVVSPDSFLLGKYYSKIRKYILNNTTIKEITLLDYEPFENVTLGRTALTFYMKKNEKEKIHGQIITKKINNYQSFIYKNEIEKKISEL